MTTKGFIQISPSSSNLHIENEIFDLQETSADFLQEASQWQLTGASATTSICMGTYLLGGFQTLSQSGTLQRTYTINQPHNSVFIIFEAWMMGKWYPNDQATIQVKSASTTFSSQPFVTITTGAVEFKFGGLCTSDPDSDFSNKEIFVSSPHQGSELTLLIQSSTSVSSRTFGIRNVRILISNAVVTTPKQCIDVSLTSVSNDCPCPVGKTKSGLSCVNCDPSCQSCFSGTSSGCYSCSLNYYYDGTSCQKCATGCATCDGGAATDCLTCETGKFMFPSGACKSCGAYYTSGTVGGIQHCYFPCSQINDFYYIGDSTCRSECEDPFTSTIDANGAKFCHYPCQANEYLYPDETTCLTTQCPDLLEVKNYFNALEYKYCKCVSPNVLMTDGSCVEPIIPPDPEPEPEPEEEEEEFETDTDDETAKKLGKVGNTTGVINSVAFTVAAVALPGDPGGVSAGALTRIIQYSKFLNISFPEKLVLMFKAYNPASGVVSLIPKMSNEQKSRFRDEPIPYNFMAYGVHSCFVVNFWNFMLFLLILFAVCAGCLIMEKLLKEVGIWIRKVRVILQNFWIVQLYNSSGDIILFSIVQFENNSWNSSSESTLNFLIAILFLLVVIIVLAFHLRTLLEYQKMRKKSSDLKAFEKNYECQQIFFGSFANSTINHQLFLFYFVLRVMLVNLLIAVLTEYPMIQTILMVAVSLILVAYLVLKRPFRSKIDLAQNLSYEVVLLTVNIVLLSFAFLDGNDEEKIDTRNSLAEVIIVCSIIFTFLPLIFMVLKAIVLGFEFYKEYQLKRGQKETVKGKLDFVQRVEELRMTRRCERHQDLRIIKPRENIFRAQNIDDSVLDLNSSSFILENQNQKKGNEQFLDSSPALYPLNHNNMMESKRSRMSQLTRNNNPHHLSPELPFNLSTSVCPLDKRNSQMINDQNTSSYLDSGLDFTLPETQFNENTMTREIEFIPNRSPKRTGRERKQSNFIQQDQRKDVLARHPFQQELRNHVNDGEGMIEEIMARNRRVSERIKKRMHGSSRKVSDIS